MRTLEEIRREIDTIDTELSALVVRRLRLADDVAAAKRAEGRPIEDPAREASILSSLAARVPADGAEAVRQVYRTLFSVSKARQARTLACAFLALLAAFAGRADTVYLDELDLGEMSTGWGYAQVNRSIAGKPLTLGTNVYARGVGTHATSELTVRLDGKARAFDATVGVDRGAETPGTGVAAVKFLVRAGERILAESPPMKADDPPFALHADLTGVGKVVLVADDAGRPDRDHADWCEARFTMAPGAQPVPVPPFDMFLGRLSPEPGPAPRINGPSLYGVRPGHPILYRVPVSGARPMKIAVTGLPAGVRFDAERGILSGTVAERGTYALEVTAENAHGTAARAFRLVVGDRIALTPPMGWNSWNCFAHTVTERNIRDTADALEKTGLADHGWSYVNIDDFWQHRVGETDDETLKGPERNADGTIAVNGRFPSMRGLADYVHAKGFRIGLYSSPGPTTCGGCAGSWKHEWQDARTYASWGFDYLKYDWCGYADVVKSVGSGHAAYTLPYRLMGEALAAQNRDILLSICQYGMGDVSTWGANAGGQCWRTTQDITDSWSSLSDILRRQADLWPYAGPGAWNDPDMLVVGRLGWGEMRPSRLKTNEQYTHVSFWSILCAPLLIGCDLTRLDDFTRALLTNDEVLETNQDELGAQAARVQGCELAEVWAKPMADGSLVFALFNKTTERREVAVELAKLGVRGPWRVRDLWRRTDLGVWSARLPREVYPHATELLRLHPVDADSRLAPGLRDIRDNATYLHFSRARPVDKPGLAPPAENPCVRCPPGAVP